MHTTAKPHPPLYVRRMELDAPNTQLHTTAKPHPCARRAEHDALPQESLDIFATPEGHLASEWRALQEVSEAVMVVERRNVRKAKGRFKVWGLL